jgi:hypothetical protein
MLKKGLTGAKGWWRGDSARHAHKCLPATDRVFGQELERAVLCPLPTQTPLSSKGVRKVGRGRRWEGQAGGRKEGKQAKTPTNSPHVVKRKACLAFFLCFTEGVCMFPSLVCSLWFSVSPRTPWPGLSGTDANLGGHDAPHRGPPGVAGGRTGRGRRRREGGIETASPRAGGHEGRKGRQACVSVVGEGSLSASTSHALPSPPVPPLPLSPP